MPTTESSEPSPEMVADSDSPPRGRRPYLTKATRPARDERVCYPTDLTDEQWEILAPLLPAPKTDGRTGRPREFTYREIVNGIFYVLRTGCTWEMMPHDLPPHSTCEHYFCVWRHDGTWKRIHDSLRDRLRKESGREISPSAAMLDSQSVKTAEKGGLSNRRLLAMMQESASRDVNDIFSSTRTAC
jgi:putative transposase